MKIACFEADLSRLNETVDFVLTINRFSGIHRCIFKQPKEKKMLLECLENSVLAH